MREAQGRDRLERTLVRLSLAGPRSREAEPPRGRARRLPAKTEQKIAAAVPAPLAVPTSTSTPTPATESAHAPEPASEPLIIELPQLGELLDRLDRLDEKLEELHRPARPLPATRDVFSEWVRLRRWEEMPFGDFLRLRRAGRI